MFYHAALLFDYEGFAAEAKPLARAAGRGELGPLHERASQIASLTSPEALTLARYGAPLAAPLPLAEAEKSQHRNSEIGQWLLLVMSQYVRPSAHSLGLRWRSLVRALESLRWDKRDIEAIWQGLPVGLLVTEEASDVRGTVLRHCDPYWRWIRPLYSYNEGGWLSLSESQRLRAALQRAEPSIRALGADESYRSDPQQNQVHRVRAIEGLERALAMLAAAVHEHEGLYMVILWDWDSEDSGS